MMTAWQVLPFVLAFLVFLVAVFAFAEWFFSREKPRKIICWNCYEGFVEADNCPVCGVVKDKPNRCACGRLHPAGQKLCDGDSKGRMR